MICLDLNQALLVSCSETFQDLQRVRVGGTEFHSTGCVVYSFGRELPDAEYRFNESKFAWWDSVSACF